LNIMITFVFDGWGGRKSNHKLQNSKFKFQ